MNDKIEIPNLEQMREHFADQMPFAKEFNLTCEAIEPDLGVTRFTYDDRFVRPGGYINGGTLMVLADIAVYVAIFSRLGWVPMAVTNELKMNFLRPALGEDVLAYARLRKLGRRVAFADVDVAMASDRDRLVAHATATYIIPD